MNHPRQRPLGVGPLRAFEAVARRSSFRAAGEELHLTQPAISRQIRSLEDEIGATLFLRGTRHVELTSAAAYDRLIVSGNVLLGGTLALQCFGGCMLGVGQELVLLDAAGQLSGTFSAVTLAGFQTGAFDVVYDLVDDRVLLRVTQAVTPAVPEPGTWALLAGGLGVLGWRARRRSRG